MRGTQGALATTAALALLTGCGTGGDAAGADRLTVVAAFYPLEYAAQQVVGDLEGVTVTTLTSPGVEPHDLELTPRQVGSVQDAALVIYSSGMQAAVDEAVEAHGAGHSLDLSSVVDLGRPGDDHADATVDDQGEDDDRHEHGTSDPHFWLDPTQYATAADAVAQELATVDPDHAEEYLANAEAFTAQLQQLDAEFAAGLADCERTTIVTSHEAFGHLAERYGLDEVGITGVSPDTEASPARVAEVSRTVEELGATTIYSEVILGPELAEVIAQETGAQVLLLDPIEGITDTSPGSDYLEVMRANLESLRRGQGCR
jgi:zinc transport system substrate-binding protein